MKKKCYSVEQIVAAVKQHELGMSVADIARKLGIAEQTFYRLEAAVRWPGAGRSPGTQATARGERQTQEGRG